MRPRRLRLDIEEREGRRWSSDGDEGRGQVGSLAAAAVVGRISMVDREREREKDRVFSTVVEGWPSPSRGRRRVWEADWVGV